MIRNAVGMLMTRIAVAATTKRTSQMLSARNWMIVGPNRTRTAISPTVRTSTTGRIEKISFPGSVSRDQVLDRVVTTPVPGGQSPRCRLRARACAHPSARAHVLGGALRSTRLDRASSFVDAAHDRVEAGHDGHRV